MRILEQALELRKQVAEREPSNNFFKRNVGRTLLLIGYNQSARGLPRERARFT